MLNETAKNLLLFYQLLQLVKADFLLVGVEIDDLRSLQPLFTKLAKAHISAQFFVFVLGWYTYFETAQVFSFVSEKRGQKSEHL